MRRREEKRRELHEALLQTLYPPSSPPSPSSSPSPPEVADDKPFDVTLINPEDYLKIDSSNHGDVKEKREESEIPEKPSRAQRKRLRKKMLKEEAARRKKLIGPLLPTHMLQTHDETRVGDVAGSNVEDDSDGDEEEAGGSNICSQPVRLNAQENKEEKFGDNDKTRRVKKRREAKKLAKESSKVQDPTSEIPN